MVDAPTPTPPPTVDADVEVPPHENTYREPAPQRSRPKLDLAAALGGPTGTSTSKGGERKKGRSMFGMLVGTLNRAKVEDKERSASEAAKKRQMIDQRLQSKLRRETDSVRRAEEVKKDRVVAVRKEEELQLKDSLVCVFEGCRSCCPNAGIMYFRPRLDEHDSL
jgi:hypothetical protein